MLGDGLWSFRDFCLVLADNDFSLRSWTFLVLHGLCDRKLKGVPVRILTHTCGYAKFLQECGLKWSWCQV
uniref:Uncharacterized protein n=1 Tax=Anguilla anguilla TaxID=7936 RepID=A0A0E9T5G7_ANGAN